MKIVFLLDNAYGIGGTIRSTVNLSRALAERHDVEVVSVRRTVERPSLPFDPRITLTPLLDLRRSSPAYDGDHRLYHRLSERFTEGPDHFVRGIATRLGDVRIAEFLESTDADAVIGTRPKINDYLAAYGSDRYVRIGQEHLTQAMHRDHIRTHQNAAIPGLDAFVTVSYADAVDYRNALPEALEGGTRIVCIPNAVPAPEVEPSQGEAKVVVAAGRLIKVKRYDRLIRAFELVAAERSDWKLRLYGRGRQQASLRNLVNRLGLSDHVSLMGAHSPLETEWAKGSIAAVTSDAESFGMTLVEAMHCGVPVISTDAPYGPGEIIADGRDGLLTPLGDEQRAVRALADAMLRLIEDPGLRRRMAEAARHKAARYAPDRIAAEYEALIEGVREERPAPAAAPAVRPEPAARPAARGAGRARGAVHTPRRPLTPRRVAVSVLRPVVHLLRGQGSPLPAAAVRARVAPDGSVTFRVPVSGLPEGDAALLLRARRNTHVTPVRVPLPPREQAVDGWVEARLDRSAHSLAEARWDTYVERVADGKRRRVRAAQVETARLLTLGPPPPSDAEGLLNPWVPYTTSDGYLALRAWRRASHAEVTSIGLQERGYTLRAVLYGQAARSPEAPVLAGVSRTDPAHNFTLPADAAQDAGQDTEGTLTFQLPYDLPAALGSGDSDPVWDLWVQPGPDRPQVRMARLLGDLADRKKTDVHPAVRLGDSETGVRLRFTLDNGLAVNLQPLGDETAGKAVRPGAREHGPSSHGTAPARHSRQTRTAAGSPLEAA
ncbi:glycosyltransferase family 4 protein [Streptomyces boncukensis]|uniref:D-inositol 3-phosphate glycosyltransferase n=1 Tax=Streptomyces boncukensis TaxID=2711219 RepID=A0A6G4X6F0_9ACTN|nr:glycosyltransferase family 4 protein [Streptomyces boncukensis]NGO72324.1 glycosyltransferase family 4 protein [Streptomyces boncukensis]